MSENPQVPGMALDASDKGSDTYWMQMREAGNLPVAEYPDGHLRTIMRMAVPDGATFAEAAGFMSICHSYRLNPILGQAFLAKSDDGKVKVLTGRDTFITLAESQEGYRGIANGVVYKGERCVIQRNPKDPFEVWIEHEQSFEERTQADIIGGYCVVYDANRPPIIMRRFWKDYQYLWGNPKKKNWTKNGTDMIENRAIAAGLRRMYSLAGLLIAGEEDTLGSGKGSDTTTDDGSEADRLKAQLGKMEKTNGITVEEEWSPEVVITRGKHEGKRWLDLADEDPKYVRQCAHRKWLGLTAKDAKEIHSWLDGLEANADPPSVEEPEEVQAAGEHPPQPSSGESPPSLDDLHSRAEELRDVLIGRQTLSYEESEEIDLLFHDGNYDGLALLVAEFERRAAGGGVTDD